MFVADSLTYDTTAAFRWIRFRVVPPPAPPSPSWFEAWGPWVGVFVIVLATLLLRWWTVEDATEIHPHDDGIVIG